MPVNFEQKSNEWARLADQAGEHEKGHQTLQDKIWQKKANSEMAKILQAQSCANKRRLSPILSIKDPQKKKEMINRLRKDGHLE